MGQSQQKMRNSSLFPDSEIDRQLLRQSDNFLELSASAIRNAGTCSARGARSCPGQAARALSGSTGITGRQLSVPILPAFQSGFRRCRFPERQKSGPKPALMFSAWRSIRTRSSDRSQHGWCWGWCRLRSRTPASVQRRRRPMRRRPGRSLRPGRSWLRSRPGRASACRWRRR